MLIVLITHKVIDCWFGDKCWRRLWLYRRFFGSLRVSLVLGGRIVCGVVRQLCVPRQHIMRNRFRGVLLLLGALLLFTALSGASAARTHYSVLGVSSDASTEVRLPSPHAASHSIASHCIARLFICVPCCFW